MSNFIERWVIEPHVPDVSDPLDMFYTTALDGLEISSLVLMIQNLKKGNTDGAIKMALAGAMLYGLNVV